MEQETFQGELAALEAAPDSSLEQWSSEVGAVSHRKLALIVFFIGVLGVLHHEIPAEQLLFCDPGGYAPDRYIACFGDYEHGAIYFDIEPGVTDSLRKAEVLFLGNSHTQRGFSTESTEKFFRESHVSYYLLGFGFIESNAFPLKLIERFKLRPKVLVINTDPFFRGGLSAPASKVANGTPLLALQYWIKRQLQELHRHFAERIRRLGFELTVTSYRSRTTGASFLQIPQRVQFVNVPLPEYRYQPSLSTFPAAPSLAREFIARAGVSPQCVIFTAVPTSLWDGRDFARQLAVSIGVIYVEPDVAGLQVFDGSHLASESAERWSASFLAEIGPVFNRCIGVREQRGEQWD